VAVLIATASAWLVGGDLSTCSSSRLS